MKCKVCGNDFEVPFPALYAYKRKSYKTGANIWLCSYKCMREWDKKNARNTTTEYKLKRREAEYEKLLTELDSLRIMHADALARAHNLNIVHGDPVEQAISAERAVALDYEISQINERIDDVCNEIVKLRTRLVGKVKVV